MKKLLKECKILLNAKQQVVKDDYPATPYEILEEIFKYLGAKKEFVETTHKDYINLEGDNTEECIRRINDHIDDFKFRVKNSIVYDYPFGIQTQTMHRYIPWLRYATITVVSRVPVYKLPIGWLCPDYVIVGNNFHIDDVLTIPHWGYPIFSTSEYSEIKKMIECIHKNLKSSVDSHNETVEMKNNVIKLYNTIKENQK